MARAERSVWRGWVRGALIASAVTACAVSGGCRRALITTDDDRSQFTRYDVVRDQTVPPFLEDEFGRRRPNLRGRLLEPR